MFEFGLEASSFHSRDSQISLNTKANKSEIGNGQETGPSESSADREAQFRQ